MPAEPAHHKPARPCPICGKPSTAAFRPFCSARCQDVDLNRWLSNGYRIPTSEAPDESPLPTASREDDAD